MPPKRRHGVDAHVEQNRYAVAPVSAPGIPILRPRGPFSNILTVIVYSGVSDPLISEL